MKASLSCRIAAVARFRKSQRFCSADGAIEAVHIPVPKHLHTDFALAAAKRGKHVLCEKPIALTANDAARLADISDGVSLPRLSWSGIGRAGEG
jgi:predicted dehydrogenase